MSTHSTGRHRRQHSPNGHRPVARPVFAAAVPVVQQHGFATKATAFAGGTVLAGAALFSAPAVPAHAVAIDPAVSADVALVAAPSFEDSLQALFNVLGVGTVGDLLGKVGPDLGTASGLSALLADLNPNGVTLDGITGNMLGAPVGELLTQLGVGSETIDQLVGGLVGGAGADASLYDVANAFGLGQYAGLVDALNIPEFGDATCGLLLLPACLDADSSIGDWMSSLLQMDTSNDTLSDIALGNGVTLGSADLNDLLGITDAQLTLPWDQFVSDLPIGGSLLDPATGTLGEETLGLLLNSLLPADSTLLPVTDGTELVDFLDAVGVLGWFGL